TVRSPRATSSRPSKCAKSRAPEGHPRNRPWPRSTTPRPRSMSQPEEDSMTDSPRVRRMAERIHQIVARLLDTRVKDPRLGFITIPDVRVTGDLQNATVFYTVLGEEADRAGTAAALASAKGMIRSEVGKNLGVRMTPTVDFVLDEVPETAAHLEAILRETQERDAELARLREQARPAGDPDPYKKPRGAQRSDDDTFHD